jgi:hypothetical protein
MNIPLAECICYIYNGLDLLGMNAIQLSRMCRIEFIAKKVSRSARDVILLPRARFAMLAELLLSDSFPTIRGSNQTDYGHRHSWECFFAIAWVGIIERSLETAQY